MMVLPSVQQPKFRCRVVLRLEKYMRVALAKVLSKNLINQDYRKTKKRSFAVFLTVLADSGLYNDKLRM